MNNSKIPSAQLASLSISIGTFGRNVDWIKNEYKKNGDFKGNKLQRADDAGIRLLRKSMPSLKSVGEQQDNIYNRNELQYPDQLRNSISYSPTKQSTRFKHDEYNPAFKSYVSQSNPEHNEVPSLFFSSFRSSFPKQFVPINDIDQSLNHPNQSVSALDSQRLPQFHSQLTNRNQQKQNKPSQDVQNTNRNKRKDLSTQPQYLIPIPRLTSDSGSLSRNDSPLPLQTMTRTVQLRNSWQISRMNSLNMKDEFEQSIQNSGNESAIDREYEDISYNQSRRNILGQNKRSVSEAAQYPLKKINSNYQSSFRSQSSISQFNPSSSSSSTIIPISLSKSPLTLSSNQHTLTTQTLNSSLSINSQQDYKFTLKKPILTGVRSNQYKPKLIESIFSSHSSPLVQSRNLMYERELKEIQQMKKKKKQPKIVNNYEDNQFEQNKQYQPPLSPEFKMKFKQAKDIIQYRTPSPLHSSIMIQDNQDQQMTQNSSQNLELLQNNESSTDLKQQIEQEDEEQNSSTFITETKPSYLFSSQSQSQLLLLQPDSQPQPQQQQPDIIEPTQSQLINDQGGLSSWLGRYDYANDEDDEVKEIDTYWDQVTKEQRDLKKEYNQSTERKSSQKNDQYEEDIYDYSDLNYNFDNEDEVMKKKRKRKKKQQQKIQDDLIMKKQIEIYLDNFRKQQEDGKTTGINEQDQNEITIPQFVKNMDSYRNLQNKSKLYNPSSQDTNLFPISSSPIPSPLLSLSPFVIPDPINLQTLDQLNTNNQQQQKQLHHSIIIGLERERIQLTKLLKKTHENVKMMKYAQLKQKEEFDYLIEFIDECISDTAKEKLNILGKIFSSKKEQLFANNILNMRENILSLIRRKTYPFSTTLPQSILGLSSSQANSKHSRMNKQSAASSAHNTIARVVSELEEKISVKIDLKKGRKQNEENTQQNKEQEIFQSQSVEQEFEQRIAQQEKDNIHIIDNNVKFSFAIPIYGPDLSDSYNLLPQQIPQQSDIDGYEKQFLISSSSKLSQSILSVRDSIDRLPYVQGESMVDNKIPTNSKNNRQITSKKKKENTIDLSLNELRKEFLTGAEKKSLLKGLSSNSQFESEYIKEVDQIEKYTQNGSNDSNFM